MTTDRDELKQSRLRARLALLIVVTLVVGFAGYIGFRVFRSFDVGAATGVGLIVVAATVGIASFFSPCSFPLLLTTLSRQAAADPEHRWRGALRFAAGASIGAVAFVTGFGLLLSLGGGIIARQFTFDSAQGRILRAIVGAILITMGLVQLGHIRIPFSNLSRLAEPIDRRRADVGDDTSFVSHVLYGFGYLVAGFGWTGPLLAGLAAQSLIAGSATTAVLTFSVAASMIVLLLFIASIGAAVARTSTIDRFKTSGPAVKRWGGRILIVVGAWFLFLAIFADAARTLFF